MRPGAGLQDRDHRARDWAAYEDKVARCGIRMADLLDEGAFRKRLKDNLLQKNAYLTQILKEKGF